MVSRQERDLILLVDDSKYSGLAKTLLKERRIKFSEVDVNKLTGPLELRPQYKLYPVFLVRGEAYIGFKEVKRAVNSNSYL